MLPPEVIYDLEHVTEAAFPPPDDIMHIIYSIERNHQAEWHPGLPANMITVFGPGNNLFRLQRVRYEANTRYALFAGDDPEYFREVFSERRFAATHADMFQSGEKRVGQDLCKLRGSEFLFSFFLPDVAHNTTRVAAIGNHQV